MAIIPSRIIPVRLRGNTGQLAIGATDFFLSFTDPDSCKISFERPVIVMGVQIMAYTDGGENLIADLALAKLSWLDASGNKIPMLKPVVDVVSAAGYAALNPTSFDVQSNIENDNFFGASEVWGCQVGSVYGTLKRALTVASRPLVDLTFVIKA